MIWQRPVSYYSYHDILFIRPYYWQHYIAGGDEYRHLRDTYIRCNEAFVLVYSISSRSSFTRIQGLYDEIQQAKKPPSSQVPIILVGNKADMVERAVSQEEGEEMARLLGCKFFEVSAKDGENVKKLFRTMQDGRYHAWRRPCWNTSKIH
jgi:small GTP-binding protein